MDGIHIVDKRLHRLMDTADGAVHCVLKPAFGSLQAVKRPFEVILQGCIIVFRKIFAGNVLNLFQFLDIGRAHKWCEIEVKGRDGLSAVHFVLSCLQGDAGNHARCLYSLGGPGFAVTGDESVLENIVQGVLYAGERLGGVVVLVVDVQIAVLHCLTRFRGEQIVIYKRLSSLGGELHHHTRGRVRVHIGVLAGDVIVLGFDDFQENVACLCSSRYTALVAVCDIALGDLLAGGFHQLQFHAVLNLLHGHALRTGHADSVSNLMY